MNVYRLTQQSVGAEYGEVSVNDIRIDMPPMDKKYQQYYPEIETFRNNQDTKYSTMISPYQSVKPWVPNIAFNNTPPKLVWWLDFSKLIANTYVQIRTLCIT